MANLYPFNVRVYGLLINEQREILVSDEQEYGIRFSKFPGGGLEFGEGLIDGLKREFEEECHMNVEVLSHLYTTDFFEASYFNDSQIISIYYLVRGSIPEDLPIATKIFDFGNVSTDTTCQRFRWVSVQDTKRMALTFRTDRVALEHLLQQTLRYL